MEKLTRNEIKFIRSLERKRTRDAEKAFLAEGEKTVRELLSRFHCRLLVITPEYLSKHVTENNDFCTMVDASAVRFADTETMQRASLLRTPANVLAVFDKKDTWTIDESLPSRELCLALDGIQDPGNVGTILRTADWYGVHHIFCSHDTADVFAPKVVQATMGSLARVHVHYTDLPTLISHVALSTTVFGTFLQGTSLYEASLTPHGLIVLGSEGHGISADVERVVQHRIFIPPYAQATDTAESLNVAIATAIVCAEFRRQFP